MFLPQQNPIDPTLPESMPVDEVHGWPLQVNDVLTNLFDPANPPLLAMGNNLWTGLSLIVIAWTGLADRLRRRQLPALGSRHAGNRTYDPARDAEVLRRGRPGCGDALPADHPGRR